MKIARSLTILAFLLGLTGAGLCHSEPLLSGTAYYFSFDIDTYVPYGEADISKHGCIYWIDDRVFLSLLSEPKTSDVYQAGFIKAEVILGDKKRFFIDHDGNVRSASRYYIIDKDRFVEALILKTPPHCR